MNNYYVQQQSSLDVGREMISGIFAGICILGTSLLVIGFPTLLLALVL